MQENILIVDDEESIRFTYRSFLEGAGYGVRTAENYDDAQAALAEMDFDLVFIDIILDGMTGIDLLKIIKDKHSNCQVIIITGVPTIETAAEAIRLGALDYIVKPIRQDTLLRASSMAMRHKALADARDRYRRNMEAIFRSVKDGIISVDKNMKVLEMNTAASGICNIDRNDAIGRSFAELSFKCNAGCVDALNKTLMHKTPMEFDNLECCARKQPDQTVCISATPMLTMDSDFTGAVMLIRDQTRMVRLERTLQHHLEIDNIVGNSKPIQEVYSLIKDLANVHTSVLITGESGTGKELVANAIHRLGDRNEKPLVRVNCAALTESLLESELFGHVRGAFTGAVKDKMGRFQRADGGIIFLDEIGEISQTVQLRFLRVLEHMEIERVGDSKTLPVDVRVIAATNQDLKEKVRLGSFRKDLYYRLNVVQIRMPALRDRRDDIPLLVKHFLFLFNRKFNRRIEGVSHRVMNYFMNYAWPGNIRELKNTLEHAFILCRKNLIGMDELPADFIKSEALDFYESGLKKNESLCGMDIQNALEKSFGNKSDAARLLGISRRTIYRKINEFKIVN